MQINNVADRKTTSNVLADGDSVRFSAEFRNTTVSGWGRILFIKGDRAHVKVYSYKAPGLHLNINKPFKLFLANISRIDMRERQVILAERKAKKTKAAKKAAKKVVVHTTEKDSGPGTKVGAAIWYEDGSSDTWFQGSSYRSDTRRYHPIDDYDNWYRH